MATLQEITDNAKKAVNESLDHYFRNLSLEENANKEIGYLAEILSEIQGWLFFTEESLLNIHKRHMMRDDSSMTRNLVWTLTTLFRTRFTVDADDYQRYIEHIAMSFNTKEAKHEDISLMPQEYRVRQPGPEAVSEFLKNNRFLVFLVSFYLYVETGDMLTYLTSRSSKK